MPVDYPVVAVTHRLSREGTRVRARVVGFGHGEPRLHLPGDEGQQPLLLLRFGPVLDEDGGVARIGRGDTEQRARAHGVGEDLVHVGEREKI